MDGPDVVELLVLLVVNEAGMVSFVPLYIFVFPVSLGISHHPPHGCGLEANQIPAM